MRIIRWLGTLGLEQNDCQLADDMLKLFKESVEFRIKFHWSL